MVLIESPTTIALIATAEPMLVAVVGLLALVLVGLVGMAIVLAKKRATPPPPPQRTRDDQPRPAPAAPQPPLLAQRPRPRVRTAVGGGGGGLAIATSTSSAMVCPTCRTEYHGMAYCTRDARRLVAPEEMLVSRAGRSEKSGGLVCMACRRAYEPGLRSCPHDGNELVPLPVYNATKPRRSRGATSDPAGVIARICPVCATKYDLNARFCGHDAGELVVIN